MIEIRNLQLPLSGGEASGVAYDPARLRDACARRLRCDPSELGACAVVRRAVDARKRGDVHFVATARVEAADGSPASERHLVGRAASNDVVMANPPAYEPPVARHPAERRPIVVGAGAAGLFCALSLAEAGLAPVLIERGSDPARRMRDVERFVATGELDVESNIQFGAGGAGTFSDGKLTTGTNSPANSWIARAFVDAGASSDILWQAHPHIGSDALPRVVANLVARIERAGGEVRWRTRLTELVVEGGALRGVRVEASGADGRPVALELACDRAVLACGHSARDVFELLRALGLALEPKAFSMGVRIEHPQGLVDRARYGRAAGHPSLPPADYKLSHHLPDGRGVYTFCMCPGGTVVAAASEAGGVVTNGMSEFARDGRNANAALLANVYPKDIPGAADDPLAGVRLQRACERTAFELGGGGFAAPAQLLGDFLAGRPSAGCGSVEPTYPRGVRWGSVEGALPPFVAEALRAGVAPMARRLRGFDLADAVLTGVETRSSSPVRVRRDAACESTEVRGLYPCGEGAGYAGGIMSAAADGLRCAAALVDAVNAGADAAGR